MRRIRRFFAVLLIVQFLIPSAVNALARDFRYEAEAVILNQLGIYAGVNANYFDPDLKSQVQRQTAVILLVKMFGQKSAADAMSAAEVDGILSKYVDNSILASFARPYMAYAIKTGMVSGTSKTSLGPATLIDSPSLACMILKNLGYSVTTPDEFIHSLNTLGSLSGIKTEEISALNGKTIIKDDLVGIIYWALRAAAADGQILINRLIRDNVIEIEAAAEQGLVRYDPLTGAPSIILPEDPKVVSDRDIIYGKIRDALLNVSPSVTLPVNSASDTSEEVWSILDQVLADNPQILYHSWSQYQPGTGRLELYYSKDAKTAKANMSALLDKVKSVVSETVKPGMTEYQKELALHDYVINHCSYDLSRDVPPESYSAYGALCVGSSVCEGYAEAMQLLLNEAGVGCITVRGNAASNGAAEGHAWNIVNLGGSYYHLDTTWDDPVMANGGKTLIHTYFNLTDNEIKRDHAWTSGSYPACVDTAYNYYVFNQLIAKGHDAFVKFVVDKLNQDSRFITVKISDSQNPGFDVQDALTEIMKAAGVHSVEMRPVDLYGTMDLQFE